MDTSADDLVRGFYAGLSADAGDVTLSIQRRDAVIARQLVRVGATAAEAEAYAWETSQASGRIAPVDLRSFERERLGWLARRRGLEQSTRRRYVDRTGQPSSWEVPVGRATVDTGHRTQDAPPGAQYRQPAVAAGALAAMLRSTLLSGAQ
jgi:hypothetical protein